MYNQVINRISPWAVFRLLLLVSIALFGLVGIILGLLERDVLGILGGAFLGLMAGLCIAAFGTVCCALFNLLAPVIGGIEVELSPVAVTSDEELTEEATEK